MSGRVARGGADVSSAAERSEASSAAAVLNPPYVIRGESQQSTALAQKAKVDWLNATFKDPGMSPQGFVAWLGRVLGRAICGVEAKGLFMFEHSVRMFVKVGSREYPFGAVCYGGDEQNGRWMLQLPGAACGLVEDWPAIRDALDDLDARITRLDLCADFLAGEYTVDDVMCMYEIGGFQLGGRAPKTRLAGDWLGGEDGRTFYVGRAENGKSVRAYEKGKQLGDSLSEWVRIEVQFGNRDRVIPLQALIDRDAFYAGAYPALVAVIEAATATPIETTRTEGEVSATHLLRHLKRSYGKAIGWLLDHGVGACSLELIEEVRVTGVPRRLKASSAEAGVSWADVQARMQEYHP